jgi:hypothetical protein
MALVRILLADDYDLRSGRFKSSAFTASSSDGAISCFDRDCAIVASGGPCKHIADFYPKKIPPAGGPVYFWVFDPASIPAPQPPKKAVAGASPTPEPRIVQSRSDTGDDCHHGIFDLPESTARAFFKRGHCMAGKFNNVFRCNGGQLEPISTIADIPELHRQ